MFDTQDADRLRALFNQFDVPIFAFERNTPTDPFRLFSLNESFSSNSGLDKYLHIGKPIPAVFFGAQGASIEEHCRKCADTNQHIRFRQRLELPAASGSWDVCLQYAPLPGGGDRVIAVAFSVHEPATKKRDEITFGDIAYFSALADIQLQNLISILENAERIGLFAQKDTMHPEHLAGLCRSIQQAVHDVQDSVRSSCAVASEKATNTLGLKDPSDHDIHKPGETQLVHALCQCANKDTVDH